MIRLLSEGDRAVDVGANKGSYTYWMRRRVGPTLLVVVARHQPRAIGVGYGGPVAWRTGEIIKSHHIAGWDGFRVDLPVGTADVKQGELLPKPQ